MDDFILRALAGGVGVALVAGPLGSFMIWRRMAYFGGTLAHSSLLGVALGVLAGVSLNLAVIAVCLLVALLLTVLQRQRSLAIDTLLGILAHSALALGLVVVAFIEGVRIDLMAYLFGDVLAISVADLWWIYGGGAFILIALAFIWRPLLSMTVHEELARVEGVSVRGVNLVFMLSIALIIATAMKIVGILLIVSLMIIPAAAARRFSATPERMALLASAFGMCSVAGGLGASLVWDTPAGPSMVVVASVLFALAYLTPGPRAGHI